MTCAARPLANIRGNTAGGILGGTLPIEMCPVLSDIPKNIESTVRTVAIISG
jgi:hypothetical protein